MTVGNALLVSESKLLWMVIVGAILIALSILLLGFNIVDVGGYFVIVTKLTNVDRNSLKMTNFFSCCIPHTRNYDMSEMSSFHMGTTSNDCIDY